MFQLLASYPKSGNTYVRIFLAHYLRGNVDLNTIGFPIFSSVVNFPLYMPDRRSIQGFKESRICKTHETSHGFSGRFVDRAVYIVRNPFDVCISYSRHMGISLDEAIIAMARTSKHLKGNDNIYRQHIGSWSTNVYSWLNCAKFPILILSYESIVGSPELSFRRLLEFLLIPVDALRFTGTLQFCEFSNLQKREAAMKLLSELPDAPKDQKIAFKEARGSGTFFNEGRSGHFVEKLSRSQMERILHDHGQVMEMLGYAKTI